MHFLTGAFLVFVLWENPVTRTLVIVAIVAIVALLAFALCPPVIAWVILVVVAVGLWRGAAEEMMLRRRWDEESEMIRRAQVRRARRYLDR